MRRDFLKNLGIEDKEIIDKILDENSADIGRAKGDTDELKSQITQLQTQLNDKSTELNTLKESTKDYDSLKNTITQLESDKTDLTNQLNTKVLQIQKAHAVESGVRDAKAKNVKAVMALLDMDKITFENGELSGISEQLETLKTGDDTSFLFEGEQKTPPSGTHINNPPNKGGTPPTSKSFAEAVAKAINKTN
jgi:seryl-tRNA synthetase